MTSYTYEQLYNESTRIIKTYIKEGIKRIVLLSFTGIITDDGCETLLKVDIPYIKYQLEKEEGMLIDNNHIAQYILIKLTNQQLRRTGWLLTKN